MWIDDLTARDSSNILVQPLQLSSNLPVDFIERLKPGLGYLASIVREKCNVTDYVGPDETTGRDVGNVSDGNKTNRRMQAPEKPMLELTRTSRSVSRISEGLSRGRGEKIERMYRPVIAKSVGRSPGRHSMDSDELLLYKKLVAMHSVERRELFGVTDDYGE